jgi:hypothetical protein
VAELVAEEWVLDAAAAGWAQEREDGVQPQKDGSSRSHGVAPLSGGHQRQSSEVAVETHEVVEMVAEQYGHPCAVASHRQDASHLFLRLPTHACAWGRWLKEFYCCGHDLSWYDLVLLRLQQRAQQLAVVPHQLYQRTQNYLDDAHMAVEDSSSQQRQVGQG